MKIFAMISVWILVASAAFADLKIYDGKVYKPLKVQEYQNLKLSVDCFKGKTPTCEAWSAAQKQAPRANLPQALAGNPAARYCLDAGGENRIAKSEKGGEFDYCLFKDGSMIEAWGLYLKFNPVSERK
ncbi:DUF333 domain-containing protein [Bdellovibrio bacteriovorus]|uniref:DUF333 domain-containing protein n=2 Tax=Bdellovibrio bacteriovorus TaxID=959 RepID=Q6MHR7_BDEBA|nr:DUF333 domain-containing protein [Bdellovibrio bacteriovorus]CAE78265.1 conserved hypothetical protein [Bdellovibrio bacteriovorus HD100]